MGLSRAASLQWELASEGIPLSSNSRKIAPGTEISRGACGVIPSLFFWIQGLIV